MGSKRVTERSIKSFFRRMFKEINKEKEYAFITLLSIFTYIVLKEPTTEKVIIYICSIIAIYFVINKDNDIKMKQKLAKNNM
mgnify:FL=1